MNRLSYEDSTWERLVDAAPLLLLAAITLVGATWLGAWLFCTVSARRGQPPPPPAAATPPPAATTLPPAATALRHAATAPPPATTAPPSAAIAPPTSPPPPVNEQDALADTIRVLEEVNDLLTKLEGDLPKLEPDKEQMGEGTRRKMTHSSTVMQIKLTRLAEDLETISKTPTFTHHPRPDT